MLLKNELRFLFSKRNILVLILVLIGVLSVYFFKYNTEYEQYASNQIMYYYEMINEDNHRSGEVISKPFYRYFGSMLILPESFNWVPSNSGWREGEG